MADAAVYARIEQRSNMKQRTLGSLSVSEVGVGCNNFGTRLDQAGAQAVVDAALESGVNFFDTADIYGATKSEVFLGEALGARRSEVVIATKFGMPLDDTHFGAKPEYVRAACDDSLRRLNTDYIDLYQLHFPDDTTPIADTLGALQELVAAGKVREIGCSNFTADQLREAKAAAGSGPSFVSVQNQYSLLERAPERDGVLDACAELGIGFLPFYPLANGLLTGKIRPGEPLPEGTRLANMPKERSVALAERRVLRARAHAARVLRGHSRADSQLRLLLALEPPGCRVGHRGREHGRSDPRQRELGPITHRQPD